MVFSYNHFTYPILHHYHIHTPQEYDPSYLRVNTSLDLDMWYISCKVSHAILPVFPRHFLFVPSVGMATGTNNSNCTSNMMHDYEVYDTDDISPTGQWQATLKVSPLETRNDHKTLYYGA